MSGKISKRRKTIHDIGLEKSGFNPRITEEQEEILIQFIMGKWDIIENKRTDKNLTNTTKNAQLNQAWTEVGTAFSEVTGVSCIHYALLIQSVTLSNNAVFYRFQ